MNKIKRIIYFFILLTAVLFINIDIVRGATIEITTETLNLRSKASTDSNIVAQISIGDECELLEEEGEWYKVKYGEYTGYISKEYAKVVGEESDKENSNSNETNTENNTDTNEEKTNSISDNETTDKSEQNSVDETKTEEIKESEENYNDVKELKEANVKEKTPVRIVPLISGSVIENLKANSKVTVINQMNGWAYIQTDTISGWIRANVLIEKESNKDSTSKSETTEKSDNDVDTSENENKSDFTEKTMYTNNVANIRKEASSNADILMVVETNTSLKVVGETGDWYEVETSMGNAFISKELLSDEKVTVTNRGNVTRTSETEKNTTQSTKSKSTSTSSSSKTSEIVSYAKKFLGVPYVYGGASPSGFDCSGFTMYVYNHFGISMRHGAQAQATLGKAVSTDKSSKSSLLNNLKAGDLVFFLDYETMDEIGHCGIYIGDGNFIHASSGSGYCVKINSLLPGEYYNTRYCAARRII